MPPKPRVILESPYAGDVDGNRRYAHACLLDSLTRGEAPIASHLLYTQVLDDHDPDQRALGITAGLAWLSAADYMVVYTDRGISAGMAAAVKLAEAARLPVYQRALHAAK